MTSRASVLALMALLGAVLAPVAIAEVPAPQASAAKPSAGFVTQDLSPAEAFALGRGALDNGRPDIAREVALQILTALPDDAGAWMLLSAADVQLGNFAAGVEAGKTAYRLGTDQAMRFEAAYLTALAHSAADAPSKAKFWLRRASDHAPDAASASAVATGFQELSVRMPWRFKVNAAAGPSANVNGGSEHGTMVIFGLPFTIPEALPGGTWTLGVEAGYRLKQTDRSLTEAFGIVQHRGVWLSDEARALAPTATSRDFALSQVEAGVSHRWKPGDRPLVLGVTGSLGQYWFGGDALSRVLRLSGQAVWSQSEDQVWSAGLSTEKSWNIIRSDRASDTMQLSLGWQRGLGAKGSFSAMAGLRNVASPAADIDHEAGFLRLGYAQAANPEGLEAALSLGIEARSYTLVPAFPTEIKLDAEASLTFNQLDYMGFSPRLTVNAERNRSDFLPRDTRDVSVGLGISSQF